MELQKTVDEIYERSDAAAFTILSQYLNHTRGDEMAKRRSRYNNHHTQFYRNWHESQPDLARIRNDSRLIVPLDIDAHDDLHRNVAAVPPLTSYVAARALKLFREYDDAHEPVENVQNYMRSIEEALKHPRTQEIERSMGELTMAACEMQLPYIRSGYVATEKYANDWELNAA